MKAVILEEALSALFIYAVERGFVLDALWRTMAAVQQQAVDRLLQTERLSQQVGLLSSAPAAGLQLWASACFPQLKRGLGLFARLVFFDSLNKTVGFWAGRCYIRCSVRGGSDGLVGRAGSEEAGHHHGLPVTCGALSGSLSSQLLPICQRVALQYFCAL